MGTRDSTSKHTLEETLDVFSRGGAPLTANEVADELDCARRTAYGKLEELADDGRLETKKVGARGRVWWRPGEESGSVEGPGGVEETGDIEAGNPASLEQAQFQELVGEIADYAIFVLDADGRVRTWNEGASLLKGYAEEEIVGEHFSTFYTEPDREEGRPERNLEAATEEGRIEDEGWRVRADGSTFWANVTITALRNDGELQGFIKITRDMTERHAYEERLRTEKERFETLVREVKDYAIFLLDEDGIVQTWNEGASQLKGYAEEEIVGEHFSTFYTEADREEGRPERNLETATEEGRIEDEGQRVRADGSTFWANVTITALFDDDGEVRGYAKVTRDMTERHRYEERLREQRDELDELDGINEVIRDVDQGLVTATSREEIEQTVCDRLAASDAYSAAWTAEYAEDYQEITPRAWAGIDGGYLDAIRAADAGSDAETESGVGAEALRTRTIEPIQQLHVDEDGEPWRDTSLTEGYESAVTIPLVYDEVEYGVLTVYADRESAFSKRKIAVLSELGETISHAMAAIRRKERERTLTAIQESTRELLHTATHEGIGDVIVETLTDDLAMADATVYHFDTTENALQPVSSSFDAEPYASQLVPLTAGVDSPVWTSFVDGETQFSETAMPSREVGSRRAMVLPLGDHGVLVVATAQGEMFDADTRNLVELVGTTAEAAFDRVETQANIRERDELLQEQNQRLQRLNGINTIIREVDQGLVQATTREEIQRVVCDRLTKRDRFRFAWIATPDDVDGGLTPRSWSGNGRGYLDGIELAAGPKRDESEPTVSAARTGDVTVVSNVAENLRGGRWRKEAFSREFQSVMSVPRSSGDVTYGVLSGYADSPGAFAAMERSVFAELAETVANAIDAVDTKHALLSDDAVELEFEIEDESTNFLARFADGLGCEVSFEGAIPLTEGKTRLFMLVRDAPADDVRDALDRAVAVDSAELVATRDDGHLVEAVVSGRTIVGSLLERGASLQTLSASADEMRLTVELPSRADVREFVQRFQQSYENAVLVAHRQRERPVQSPDGIYAGLEKSLTDRQLEVLQTAYFSGFFASPRQSTGGDVAELLDVSQPTVTEQLRTAQCKLLDMIFGDARAPAPE